MSVTHVREGNRACISSRSGEKGAFPFAARPATLLESALSYRYNHRGSIKKRLKIFNDRRCKKVATRLQPSGVEAATRAMDPLSRASVAIKSRDDLPRVSIECISNCAEMGRARNE